jgi:outer membrane protein
MRQSLLLIAVYFGLVVCAVAAAPNRKAPTPAPAAAARFSKASGQVLQLDLATAENIALRQSPAVLGAQFKALAAQQVVRQVRSAFFPQITLDSDNVANGNDIARFLGGSPYNDNTTYLAASGGLNSSSVYSRQANGILISQLITDFGRTWNLTAASKSQALSEVQRSVLARAKAMLWVDNAYFQAQQAQALLRVADETVQARQLVADQVGALAKNKLRSELDVSFALVTLDEAKLLRLQAQNQVDSSFAEFSNALGYPGPHRFVLSPIPQFALPQENLAHYIGQALSSRPEALALRHEYESWVQTAAADRAAHYPKVMFLGAAGRATAGDSPVYGDYSAAGIDVEVPIFTGFRLSARDQETSLRAQAAKQALTELEDLIAKDVDVALLNTNNAADKIKVTQSLLGNAQEAYDLAQAKYQIGLTSIVELSQAQLFLLQAQINHTTATYGYQIDRLVLDFQIGAPRFLQSPSPVPAVRGVFQSPSVER